MKDWLRKNWKWSAAFGACVLMLCLLVGGRIKKIDILGTEVEFPGQTEQTKLAFDISGNWIGTAYDLQDEQQDFKVGRTHDFVLKFTKKGIDSFSLSGTIQTFEYLPDKLDKNHRGSPLRAVAPLLAMLREKSVTIF